MLTIDSGTNGVAKIAQQVPAVGDLNSLWRTLAHSIRVGAGAVTCDDLDTGVLAEPTCQRFGLSVRQKVNDLVALQVDQNGAVAMAAPPGPVIDSKHARCRRRTLAGCRRSHSEQRIGTGRRGDTCCKPRSGLTAKGKGQVVLKIPEPLRPAGGNQRDIAEPLGECLAGTGNVDASEAAGSHSDRHRPALPRQIAQLTVVAAMNAP